MANPKTIEYRNPFALIQSKPDPWKGYVRSAGNFLVFDSVENGARAGMINLINTYLKRGRNTIATIIPVYAPEPDKSKIENYMAFLEAKTGMNRNQVIDTREEFLSLARYITWFEAGRDWINMEQLNRAYNAAIENTGFIQWGEVKEAGIKLGALMTFGALGLAVYYWLK